MKNLVRVLMVVAPLLVFASCGGEPPDASSTTEEQKVCTLMPIRCDAPCKLVGNGCPQQCACPGYNACGDVKCGQHEVCCTGPLTSTGATYACYPAGSLCPL